jgi:hypothetical protein
MHLGPLLRKCGPEVYVRAREFQLLKFTLGQSGCGVFSSSVAAIRDARKNNEQFKLSTRRQQLNNSKTHGGGERKKKKKLVHLKDVISNTLREKKRRANFCVPR